MLGLERIDGSLLSRLVHAVVGRLNAVGAPGLVPQLVILDRRVRTHRGCEGHVLHPRPGSRLEDVGGSVDVDAAQELTVVVGLNEPGKVDDRIGSVEGLRELVHGFLPLDIDAQPIGLPVGVHIGVRTATGDGPHAVSLTALHELVQHGGSEISACSDDGDAHTCKSSCRNVLALGAATTTPPDPGSRVCVAWMPATLGRPPRRACGPMLPGLPSLGT